MKFSLRYTIPLALIIFTLLLATWSFKTNGSLVVERVSMGLSSKLRNIMTLLQGHVEHAFLDNNLERIQEEMAGFGSNDNLKNFFGIDDSRKIFAATKFSYIGLDIEEFLPAEEREDIKNRLETIEKNYSGTVFLSPDRNTLWGIYPIRIGVEPGGIRPTRTGFLIAEVDLIRPQLMALSLVKGQVFQFVFFLGILVVGLGIFFHFQLTRRIQELVFATERFAKGDFEFRINVKGRDEITALAESMVEMAKKRKQVEKELKAANEELEKFVYTASHDLQEPLRKVIIFGDRLKETCSGKLEEDETNNIDRMQKASARMQCLINDLRGYSRLKFKINSFESVDLNILAHEVIDDLDAQITGSQGTVEVCKLPVIEGDKIQLRQLFQNLISNSLKYAKNNVLPVISIYHTVTDNDYYEICFLDNGIGLDEKYTNKIFEPFQRLNHNKDIQGTGMGLFICKKIIERHNGTITVKSTPDAGATFKITLPNKQSRQVEMSSLH
jgi:signal transduction histidine kinase